MTNYEIQKNFAKTLISSGFSISELNIPGKYVGFCLYVADEDEYNEVKNIYTLTALRKDVLPNGRIRVYLEKGITQDEMEDLADLFIF